MKKKRVWKLKAIRLAHAYLLLGCTLTLSLYCTMRPLSAAPTAEKIAQMTEVQPRTSADDEPWSYFHPAWISETPTLVGLTGEPAFDSFYTSASDARKFLEDPDDRIEAVFKVPEELKQRVTFWMEVYSHYSSRTRIVHHRDDPSRVLGYIDFRPIYRAMGPGPATETKVANIERTILKDLKERIREAAGISKPRLLSTHERLVMQKFLSQVGASTTASAKEFIESIRTQTGQSDKFLEALYRSRNLLPHIESVFRRQGLPAGLARIPFVESSFNVNAKSSVGAVGIWQFMPETARELIHDEEESLWSDPLRQTRSAARMLKLYKTVLPDWSTTITSYNSGVGRVRRIVEKNRLKNAHNFASLPSSEGLGFAGKNFYSEFLAANLVEAYKTELFSRWLPAGEFAMIFSGASAFPKDICSAL